MERGRRRPPVPARGGAGVPGQDHLDLAWPGRIPDDPDERAPLVAIGPAGRIIQGDDQRVRPRAETITGSVPRSRRSFGGLRIGRAEREPPLQDADRARDVPGQAVRPGPFGVGGGRRQRTAAVVHGLEARPPVEVQESARLDERLHVDVQYVLSRIGSRPGPGLSPRSRSRSAMQADQMDAERTSVEGTRRRLAVGDVEHRSASLVPEPGTGIVADVAGPTDQVERLPERDRGRGPRHDRPLGERSVVPGVEPDRVAAPGWRGS